MSPAVRFDVAVHRVAAEPPEARGLPRDGVRLMVVDDDGITHSDFSTLDRHVDRSDLVVVNTSPTMPAALVGERDGTQIGVHLSVFHDDGTWTVELRELDRTGPLLDGRQGEHILLPEGALTLIRPASGEPPGAARLWIAGIRTRRPLSEVLSDHGAPIRYGYVATAWPLSFYQTVFADRTLWPGSAEMPSAARPFSLDLVDRLRRKGVGLATVTLHTGVSSQDAWEPPQPERFHVPARTAAAIRRTRRRGGRVIAVGTTVARALETAGNERGKVEGRKGWTDLVLRPEDPTNVVDGIITGWHPPEASHLGLLQAVAGTDLVSAAYSAAVDGPYLWHEFGDSCLLFGTRTARQSAAA